MESLKGTVEKMLADKGVQDTAQASRSVIRDQVMQQLNEVNRFRPDVNRLHAELIADQRVTMAERMGLTPEQFSDTYPLKFSAENVAGGTYDQSGKLVTDSENFKKWYGDWQNTSDGKQANDSGVAGRPAGGAALDGGRPGPLDSEGRPLRLYHGTADDISDFQVGHRNSKDHGWLGRGVYLTDSSELADSYANLKGGDAGPNVMPVYAAIKNPYHATLAEKKLIRDGGVAASEKFTEKLKAAGYDGVELTYHDGVREFVALEPTQVKGEFNRGTYDPNDANILHQDVRGIMHGEMKQR